MPADHSAENQMLPRHLSTENRFLPTVYKTVVTTDLYLIKGGIAAVSKPPRGIDAQVDGSLDRCREGICY